MVNELSTLSIRKLRKRRQKVAQTLQKLKQAKYYASLQNHPDVSHPIMSCKSSDGLNKQHEQAHRRQPRRDHNNLIINNNLYDDEDNINNPSAEDQTEIAYYQNWRKIRVLELEILRLIRDNVIEAIFSAILDEVIYEDNPLLEGKELEETKARLKQLIGENGPVDKHGFDTYLNLLENIFNLKPDFLNSQAMIPYSQNYLNWNFAQLRQILVDRQFGAVEIPEQYVLGVASNNNFTEALFLNYFNFFRETLRASNASYLDSLMNMNSQENADYQQRFIDIQRMLLNGDFETIDFVCRRDFPELPDLDQRLLFNNQPDVNAFHDPDERLFRNPRREDIR